MKKYIFVIICLMSGFIWSVAATPSSSLVFNGKKFYLQYNVGNEKERLNEYLPSGVNFDNYTEMVAVRVYKKLDATPIQLAQVLASNFKSEHPKMNYLLYQNEKTGDGIVAFPMISAQVIEANVFRTTRRNGMLMTIQYVNRIILPTNKEERTPAVKAFFAKVKEQQPSWIEMLGNMPVPAVVE